VVGQLLIQLGLDGIEQVPINDGRLLASQDLALEDHLSDVKPVAQQMSEMAAREGNATNRLACLQGPHLGDDAPLTQIYTLIATAKLNDVDPQAWLADVLARLPDHPAKRIHELLPWNWHRKNVAAVAA
jgi:hypothetical protein